MCLSRQSHLGDGRVYHPWLCACGHGKKISLDRATGMSRCTKVVAGCYPVPSPKVKLKVSKSKAFHLAPKYNNANNSLSSAARLKRVERSRNRRAPYRVDKDHEGAQKRKHCVPLSETPGYERFGHDDNAPKSATK